MNDENSAGEIESVTAEEAIAAVAVGDTSTVLVDVREQDEWDRGHAPSAIHLPMSALEQRYNELPNDADLLIICHSGGRSLRVTDALERAGYNAINVEGGMLAWHAAGGAIVTDEPGQQG